MQVLDKMSYAPAAHHNLDRCCLPGTRMEIIESIVYWATGAQLPQNEARQWGSWVPNPNARVLWVCGMSGAGKSTIIRSVAARLEELGRLGTLYGFSDATQATTNPSTLFSTIARDLADRDSLRKQLLIDLIKVNESIRTTTDCRLQFQHFILAPSSEIASVGETVIIIDAFDESGNMQVRRDILGILTKRAHDFPSGLRFIITSRFESDVQESLSSLPTNTYVDLLLLDNIPPHLTARDIQVFIDRELGTDASVSGLLWEKEQLARNAEQSFQWASAACRFILKGDEGDAGLSARERLQQLLKSDGTLDKLYTTILDRHFSRSQGQGRVRLDNILGFLVCALQPLSLRAIASLATGSTVPSDEVIRDYQQVARLLAPLIGATHELDTPISPLHTSFTDFLRDPDPKRNKNYFVDSRTFTGFFLVNCLNVMEAGLCFNICGLPTSYNQNSAYKSVIKEVFRLRLSLSYACQFWPRHAAQLYESGGGIEDETQGKLHTVLQQRTLEWLEVMSLLNASPREALLRLANLKVGFTIFTLSLLFNTFLQDLQANLSSLIHDITRFVAMFAVPIAESAPHIYLSALAFAPACSIVRKHTRQRFPHSISLQQGRLHNWPRLLHSISVPRPAGSLAFSPDGKHLAAGCDDSMLRVWDSNTGAAIGEPMSGHGGRVSSIAFSPDGKYIASGSQDKTIRLWDMSTGTSVGEPMRGHDGKVTCLAFSPDGKHIISGSVDNSVRSWDTRTGTAVGKPLTGYSGEITSIAYSPDGKRVMSCWDNGTMRIWDASDCTVIREVNLGDQSLEIGASAYSLDGELLVTDGYGTLQIWNATTGVAIGEEMRGNSNHYATPTPLAVSPDCKTVVSSSNEPALWFWNVATGTGISEPIENSSSVVFSPDGRFVASGSVHVCIWDASTDVLANKSESKQIQPKLWDCLVFSPDSKYIVSGSWEGTPCIWEASTGTVMTVETRGEAASVNSVAYSPDGRHILLGLWNGSLQACDASTGVAIGELVQGHRGGRVQSLAFSPDGKHVTSYSDDRTVQRWDATDACALTSIGEPLALREYIGSYASTAFSPDGEHIAAASEDGIVGIWNIITGAAIGQPTPLIEDGIYFASIAFSPGGQHIVSASRVGTLRTWDARTGAEVQDPIEGCASNRPVAYLPDGKRIVSGSRDNELHIWDASTGAEIGELMSGHTDYIYCVVVSPDGKCIASCSSDRTIRLWDVIPDTAVQHSEQEKL